MEVMHINKPPIKINNDIECNYQILKIIYLKSYKPFIVLISKIFVSKNSFIIEDITIFTVVGCWL